MNFYLPKFNTQHVYSQNNNHQAAILQDHLKKHAAEMPCVGIPVYLPVLYAICFIIAGPVSSAPQKTFLKI